MSYISWRQNNREEEVLNLLADGKFDQLPAWRSAKGNILSSVTTTPVVDMILTNDNMIPVNFGMVFLEYLFEEYHIKPVDIDIYTRVMLESDNAYTAQIMEDSMALGMDAFIESSRDILPDDLKENLDEILLYIKKWGEEQHDEESTDQEPDKNGP